MSDNQPRGCEYTPEEVGAMLGNRVIQPHYAAWLVRKAIAQATDTHRAELEALRSALAECREALEIASNHIGWEALREWHPKDAAAIDAARGK